ncbi:hypothetical protein EDC01DRAFT_779211 [Geopyxis carbonaria]|nr:hypothetical protein EDC01DRAFT_779211 [Geopyxis carbonaria]
MASGYGLKGGYLHLLLVHISNPARNAALCYPFWQDFLACYVSNTADSSEEGRWRCVPQKNDYYECLHHRKEAAKVQEVRAAYLRRLEQGGAIGSPQGGKAGDAKSLGVLK